MLVFAALLLSAQAASSAAVLPDNIALNAYRQACVGGALKLSNSQGRLVKPGVHVDVVDFASRENVANQTVVELYGAKSTFLIITEYKRLQPRSIAKSCVLVSRSVSKREAIAAYIEGIPEKDVTSDWVPSMYLSMWISDHPELGFRKRLWFRGDGRIVLEIGTYPANSDHMNIGTAKQ